MLSLLFSASKHFTLACAAFSRHIFLTMTSSTLPWTLTVLLYNVVRDTAGSLHEYCQNKNTQLMYSLHKRPTLNTQHCFTTYQNTFSIPVFVNLGSGPHVRSPVIPMGSPERTRNWEKKLWIKYFFTNYYYKSTTTVLYIYFHILNYKSSSNKY